MAFLGNFSSAFDALPQQRLGDAMNDEIGVAADGRGEMRIGGCGEREVALINLGVARLAKRAKHEVAENPFLWLAFNACGKPLIHLRRNGDIFGHFVSADLAATALRIASIAAGLDALDGECAETKRVAEAGGEFLELHDAARLRLLVDAIERWNTEVFEP